MGCFFQFPLSRGCTPALYEEQAFWKRFSIPLIKRLYSLAIYFATGIFEYHFQFPLSSRCTLALYEEQPFWNTFFNSPNQAGLRFVIIWGIGILEYHFQFPLSRGCTLWHSYEEQAFGMPFSINPIKRVSCMAFI